jgi:2'-5' RNA ligase
MSGIPPHERRTGLLIPVPADDLVADFRRRFNAATVARNLPPHITVIFPFARVPAVDDGLRADLVAHFTTFEPFEAELTRVGSFPGYVWLAPTPRERFVELITATCERYPAFPPYEGEGGEPEPHLTIAAIAAADDADPIVELAHAELAALLPFRFTVSSLSLFEEQEDGTFLESTRFGLG